MTRQSTTRIYYTARDTWNTTCRRVVLIKLFSSSQHTYPVSLPMTILPQEEWNANDEQSSVPEDCPKRPTTDDDIDEEEELYPCVKENMLI